MTGDGPTHDTRSAKLAALQDYWQARRCGRRLPGRRDIDPVDLPGHLSTLLLIDGIAGRYRFRLVGTKLTRLMVRDPTGLHLDQVLEESELEVWDDLLGHLALHREPLAVRGHLSWASGWALPVEWVLLPLASDGTTVDMVVAGVEMPEVPPRLPAGRPRFSFSWPPPAAAGRWTGDGPTALKRWLNGVSGAGLVAPSP